MPGQIRLILWTTATAAALGAAYSQLLSVEDGGRLIDFWSLARGLMTGATIGGILTTTQAFVLDGPIGAPLRALPFPAHVAVKTAIYLAVILFALAAGAWAFPRPGADTIARGDVLFSLGAAFVFVFMTDVNQLLGQNVLINFITGRYHKPRLESRVFLFLDMQGSTALAERLGPLAFHRLLNRFVLDLTAPIVAARGEIHSYVGDELIATWPLDRDAPERSVIACFAAMERARQARGRLPARVRRRDPVSRRPSLRTGGGRRNGLGEEGDCAPWRHREHHGPHSGPLP